MAHESVAPAIKSSLATKVLVSALTASAVSAFLTGGEFSDAVETLPQIFVSVGGPTAIGALVMTAVDPHPADTMEGRLFKSVVGGGVAVGLMIYAGALPAVMDRETFSLIGVVSAGLYVGDIFEPK